MPQKNRWNVASHLLFQGQQIKKLLSLLPLKLSQQRVKGASVAYSPEVITGYPRSSRSGRIRSEMSARLLSEKIVSSLLKLSPAGNCTCRFTRADRNSWFQNTPRLAARWPPAENPMTATCSGIIFHSAALRRTMATAPASSSKAVGKPVRRSAVAEHKGLIPLGQQL